MKNEELNQISLLQENVLKLREKLLKQKDELLLKGSEITTFRVESKKMLKELTVLQNTTNKLLVSHNTRLKIDKRKEQDTPYIIKSEILKKVLKVENYSIASFNLNTRTSILKYKDLETKLTRKEASLLALFAANINEELKRSYILNSIWDESTYLTGRSMDVYMCKLRKLLEPDSSVNIVNYHGKGYKLSVI